MQRAVRRIAEGSWGQLLHPPPVRMTASTWISRRTSRVKPGSGRRCGRNAEHHRMRADEGIGGEVLQSGEPLFQPDTARPRILTAVYPRPRRARDFAERAAFSATSSCRCRPARNGWTSSPSFRHTPGHAYTDEDFETVQELARRVGMAIANARLFRDAQRALVQRMEAEAQLRMQFEHSRLLNDVSDLLARDPDSDGQPGADRDPHRGDDGRYPAALPLPGAGPCWTRSSATVAIGTRPAAGESGRRLADRSCGTGEVAMFPAQEQDRRFSSRQLDHRAAGAGSGYTLGAIRVSRGPRRPYSEEDLLAVRELADRLGSPSPPGPCSDEQRVVDEELRHAQRGARGRVSQRTGQLTAVPTASWRLRLLDLARSARAAARHRRLHGPAEGHDRRGDDPERDRLLESSGATRGDGQSSTTCWRSRARAGAS